MLSEQTIKEFKELYLKRYGVVLNNNEASEKALRYLRLFKLVYKPIPRGLINKVQERKKT